MHHFLSYSSADAPEFALKLHDALEAGPPPVSLWLDKRDLVAGRDWDGQIAEAIRSCDSLLFVMTKDSVEDASVCKDEWSRALKYKKPIVPILLHRDADAPFRLGSRQHIDFTGPFDPALAKLRRHLEWLASPAGVLAAMKDRLADAVRDLRREPDPQQQTRIEEEISGLQAAIADQQRLVDDPIGAAKRVERSIAAGLERERQPEKPVSGIARTKFINPPPGVAPSHFQDRHVETALIGDFLKDESKRLMTVLGRGGIGKTAMVCRLLKGLESGQLPDDGGPLAVDGIVYLSALGSRRVNAMNLFADLGRLLPDDAARVLDATCRDPKLPAEEKMRALLAAFPEGRTVVLLDNFEDVVDPESHAIRDAELDEALRALLKLPHHGVKVVVTTRILPRDLAMQQPARQGRIDLDEGLPSPHAENILRAMDADGKVGLKAAPDALLDQARVRTRGFPRALEALFAILSADRNTTVDELLRDTATLLPENVVHDLVGEAYARLDLAAQRVMQALAIYARPVTPAAVDYLLQPYLPGVDSARVLGRLVNMQFARKESGRYFLHPVDSAYALSRVEVGDSLDRRGAGEAAYTRYALWHRAAEYFKQARTPRQEWKTIEHLGAQLAEFDLRCEGQDFGAALEVLQESGFGYLLRWGYSRLIVVQHERLWGKLSEPIQRIFNLGCLAAAYYDLGQVHKAISRGEQAQAIAREIGDKHSEATLLNILGNCYGDLGRTSRTIELYEQALVNFHTVGNRSGEGVAVGALGIAYRDLGQTARAIASTEHALIISREVRDRSGEGYDLVNLGSYFSHLGQAGRAILYAEESLAVAREIGDRSLQGYSLNLLASTLIDGARHGEAISHASETVRIGEETGSLRLESRGNCTLALARLLAEDLPAARAAAEHASRHDVPLENPGAFTLLGLIALRQNDLVAARVALADSVFRADALLAQEACLYAVIDAKALALSGLAVCGDEARVAEAIAAYRAARGINRDAGIVGRVLRLHDALAVADSMGVLVGVREAAAGA